MKKAKPVIAGIVMTLFAAGCASDISQSDSKVTSRATEIMSTDIGMEEATTGEAVTEAPTESYDSKKAEQEFAALDIPASIKDIFLADGYFFDSQSYNASSSTSLSNYSVYDGEQRYAPVEWDYYIAADLNNDGKKELLYAVLTEGHEKYQTVVFHEHSDGNVYAYVLNTAKLRVGKDGAVFVADGTGRDTGALLRIKFNPTHMIETELARAKIRSQDNNEIRYYIEKQEVDADTYYAYVEPLRTGTKWTKFIYNHDEKAEEKAKEEAAAFAALDIPDSIKDIFLADGEFVDTQTQTSMILAEYKAYDKTDDGKYDLERWSNVTVWESYIEVDFDNDGKKELFYEFWPEFGLAEGVIFHEHTDGKVYAYRHHSLRVTIGENGDVIGSGGAAISANRLLRYSFDTEKIIETVITYAEFKDYNEYIYYAEGREVDEAEFSSYFKLSGEGGMRWKNFKVTPVLEESETSGN